MTEQNAAVKQAQITGYRQTFLVKDREKSYEYYKKLGFTVKPHIGFVERGSLTFILHQLDANKISEVRPNYNVDGFSWDAYVFVNNAEALYREFKENGAIILSELYTPRDRAMREFTIQDLDGYRFVFGEELKEN